LYFIKKADADHLFSKSLTGMMLIALPLSAGGLFLSEEIITFIYVINYAESSMVFMLMAVGIPFAFACTLFSYSLGAIRLQNYVAKVLLVICSVNIVLNYLLVPTYGIRGAGLASLLTHVGGCFAFWYGLRQNLGFHPNWRIAVSIVVACCFLAVTVLASKPYGLLPAVLAGSLVYAFAIVILGGRELSPGKLASLFKA